MSALPGAMADTHTHTLSLCLVLYNMRSRRRGWWEGKRRMRVHGGHCVQYLLHVDSQRIENPSSNSITHRHTYMGYMLILI